MRCGLFLYGYLAGLQTVEIDHFGDGLESAWSVKIEVRYFHL